MKPEETKKGFCILSHMYIGLSGNEEVLGGGKKQGHRTYSGALHVCKITASFVDLYK
jgi:hypothetical protein